LMGGFDRAKAQEVLGVPAEYEAVAMGAVGYVGDPASLPEALKARELAPRQRKPLQELVFRNEWQQK
ncbi:MAG: nitroreductase, partial [Pontibacter sp.]|nr:nitroreductase [Pontibacter sp.]